METKVRAMLCVCHCVLIIDYDYYFTYIHKIALISSGYGC